MKLSDLLGQNNADFGRAFDDAATNEPVPPGSYVCHIQRGELTQSRSGTPEYALTFRIIEGPFTGRLLWAHIYLTTASATVSKPLLLQLGVKTAADLAILERPIPPDTVRCEVVAVRRVSDSGVTSNTVKSFRVVGRDEPPFNPFAPSPQPAPTAPPTAPPQAATGELFRPADIPSTTNYF